MRIFFATIVSLITVATPALADEETEQLRTQVKALEARLDALEKKQAQAQAQANANASTNTNAGVPVANSKVGAVAPASLPAATGSGNVAVASATAPSANAEAPPQADVEYRPGKGLLISSPDKNFQFHFGGYVQADDHAFLGSSNPVNNPDQFFIRSARPIFEAKLYNDFGARLMLDYGNGQTTLVDAFGEYYAADAFNIRVGKFKDPIGLERWQSEQNILFVERGMTTNLVPYRDNGVEIYGNPIAHALEYEVALTNGAADLVNATNGVDDDQTVTARIFAHPFYETDVEALKGLGVGVAGSYGTHNNTAANGITNPDLTTGYVTPAQSKFFLFNTSAFADGEQWRMNPELMYYNGPFSFISEYVVEDEGVRSGAFTDTLRNKAWEAIATYVVTGEDARFDGVVPRENFNPATGQWGAFELVARTSQLRVDKAAFPIFASLATSADEAHETTFGGTWYMNPNVKLNLDFAITSFDEGAANGGDRPTEKAVLSRAQFSF